MVHSVDCWRFHRMSVCSNRLQISQWCWEAKGYLVCRIWLSC